MGKIVEFLFGLFAVGYWNMNYPYNKEYNDWCKEQLENNTNFDFCGSYRVRYGGKELWIENHPYASFTLYGNSLFKEHRPSRYTIYRLHKEYQRQLGLYEVHKQLSNKRK